MKKILRIISFILCLAMIFLIAGCASFKKDKAEVALVTDVSDIDDRSYNQYAWEGIKKYCEENHITYNFYRPEFKKTENIAEAIEYAVDNGAKIIVCPNESQADAVAQEQKKHSDVRFLFLNGVLPEVMSNTYQVNFSEVEIGFLAGYTAVKEGYRVLGFQGGVKNAKNENYGFGFIEGAQFAAYELGLETGGVTIKYNYANTSGNSPDTQARAQVWYESGTQVIFASERGPLASVICVAEGGPNRAVIGCNLDRSKLSPSVITTSKKMIEDVVYNTLKDFYDNKFKGGEAVVLGCKENGIDIELKNSRLKNFNYKDSEHIKYMLANNVDSIKDYMVTSDMVTDIPLETTSDFAALFPEMNIIVEYITT